jgi:hypothetical protein
MSSFLALHWAAFFALLGYLCIDTGSLDAVSTMLGANGIHDAAGADFAAAPAAVAFLVVAALFCWLFVEACFGESGISGGVLKIAFVAGGATLSPLLIGGAVHGAAGSPFAAAYLTALVASYVAVLGECRAAVPGREEVEATLRVFAREAADMSLLGRISGRPGFGRNR